MNLTVITPPPFEPVTLAEVYGHLRLDPEGSPATHPDDAMLSRLISTARERVEMMTRRTLVQQTLRLSCAGFPGVGDYLLYQDRAARFATVQRIRLVRPPFIRINAVQYYDTDNTLQTVAPASYYVTDDQVPELRFVSAFSSPSVYARPDALRVEYVAGYDPEGSPPTTLEEYRAAIPKSLRDAILIGVQMLYDALTPPEHERLDMMREAMIQPYRIQHT